MPRASFEAAVSWLLTAFMVLRVFWIMLGLWAEAKPAASTQTRIVRVGFVFILCLLFLRRWSGLVGRRRRFQVMTEIRSRQACRYNALTRRVLIGMLRLRIGRSAGRGHQQVRAVDNALDSSQPVDEPKHR